MSGLALTALDMDKWIDPLFFPVRNCGLYLINLLTAQESKFYPLDGLIFEATALKLIYL